MSNVTVPNTSSHSGHSFLQGKCLVSLLSLASAVLQPLWQLIGSKALLTRASLGGWGTFFGALFWVCTVRDNRLLALETQMQPTFHVSWQTKAQQHVSC